MANRVHLVIGTPCYGGQVTSHYAQSVLKLQQECRSRAIELGWLMFGGDALITRARAEVVAHFLAAPEVTHLLFVDADIGFEPSQVFRLLDFDADVTAAAYPAKMIDWELAREAIRRNRADPQAASLRYVFDVADPARIVTRAGFIQAQYAGTGFLMIRRGALLKLCAAHPELRYRKVDFGDDPLSDGTYRYALFDCMIDPESGRYLSEDFAFCRRWSQLGGDIWIDTKSKLTHFGSMAFAGDFSTQIAAVPGSAPSREAATPRASVPA